MPVITLPDGTQKSFAHSVTVIEVAAAIGAGLAKAALAAKVNQQLVDLDFVIHQDANVQIITDRDSEGIDIIRHSCAHLLAHAVKQLFPTAQVTIGPVIEDGFYYDLAFPRPLTLEDLPQIEAKMHELVKKDFPVTRKVMSRDAAVEFFLALGEKYKAEIIASIPQNEEISLYSQDNFVDLCRGPHVPSTGKIKAFKLMKLAGAYWRGDANNEMLQRIYGTAWGSQKDLDTYLHRLEEAEKRDHRKLGQKLDLFHLQEEAPGMAFWHPQGWTIYQIIEQYIRAQLNVHGYQEVRTPQLIDRSLWEKSGHWAMYHKNMFITESESRFYAVKPMNCPAHVLIFKQGLKSYRDLPIRLAEFGCCHRNELSGALHGLMRVRSLTQDDAHIFCTDNQIESEASVFIDLLFKVYKDFGLTDVIVKLATRPEQRIGDDGLWDKAEASLANALQQKQIAWEIAAGEGAFYGPKLEFHLKDCLGRVWQCGTLQVDYCQPERLDAYYIAEDGTKQRPVMLHRAICGSLERFIAILLEHYAGDLPLWLAPVHVVLLNITDQQQEYVLYLQEILVKKGLRVKIDLRNEKIGFKIREHTLKRVPYLVVVGEKERQQQLLAVRTVQGKDLGVMSIDAFIEKLNSQINQRICLKEEE